jgi:hypothetical protein
MMYSSLSITIEYRGFEKGNLLRIARHDATDHETDCWATECWEREIIK